MSNENRENEEPKTAPKIIVDSDWKEQVAKEKQVAAEQAADAAGPPAADEPNSPSAAAPPAAEADPPAAEATASAAEATVSETNASDTAELEKAAGEVASSSGAETEPLGPAPSQHLPEPTFEILVSMLFTQALSALGQMPNPIDGTTSVDKPMAKHSIDMLDMLSNKTKGNLSDDESKMLSEALHALRMGYVSVRG